MAFIFTTLFKYLVEEVVVEAVAVTTVATVGAAATYGTYRAVDAIADAVGNSSSSSSSSGFYLERRTIFDWWQNGIDYEEYERFKDWGYDVRSGCFSLEEVRTMLRNEAKAPGKPTKDDGFEPKKDWDGETLVREPHGPRRGYPHKDGSVWVPTGKGSDDGRSGPHGGSHWDVEYPNGSHRNVHPKKK